MDQGIACLDKPGRSAPAGDCVVEAMREAMRRRWREAEAAPRAQRQALARAARLIAEITLGRGSAAHLDSLDHLARELGAHDAKAAEMLAASLATSREAWVAHALKGDCPDGTCLRSRAAPCRTACPADIDIPGFLAHIARREYDDSLQVIAEDNPLPHSCGLVCPAPCEDACLRGATGSALFIRPLKALVAEQSRRPVPPARPAPTGRRIAVVGSGPAGLTVAYYLAVKGHQVEIFEAREQAGGMMRYGIPAYRLPPAILDAEIEHIRRAGVTIRTGHAIRTAADLRAQGFDAVYLALGLQLSRRTGIPGEDLPFVRGATDFLASVARGEDPRVGPRVLVIGGGNTAVDAAMTALRQGARQVTMVYRRRRAEMPAAPHELALALAEGVEIRDLWVPEQVLPDRRVVFRRSPNATEAERREGGETLTLEVDHVLAGVGQEAALSCLDGTRVEIRSGYIVADPVTAATAEPGIYAGGDVAHGASTVVAAVRAGKTAAASIDAFVMGRPAAAPAPRPIVPMVATDAVQRSVRLRPAMPQRVAHERRGNYSPIELGLTEADARREASRCLRCDACIGCGLCELVCSELGTEALHMEEAAGGRLVFDDFTHPSRSCIGCGACAAACPTGAIRIEDEGGSRATVITGTVVCRQPMLTCESCGKYYVTAAQFGRVGARLHGGGGLHRVCPDCARAQAARRKAC
ncbi:NAD(P)-binding protein [Rhodovastum atsumiense]|uniref:dihydrouracil dehydrogenase (NAD(+)) n=1 Tax=Rhodovastum atsumiense TaxID=504468 RepID=A0A5M6IZU8_9PROT|nr:FAD-dependent oxidoreductase [Rhodovastum atsumiense]KAA5613866.1 NAD(P)-binding protein [Rhodovastum atsumiense]CAH2601988.1 NAD(P)-binding protein [Rhodovastum atsumiense]